MAAAEVGSGDVRYSKFHFRFCESACPDSDSSLPLSKSASEPNILWGSDNLPRISQVNVEPYLSKSCESRHNTSEMKGDRIIQISSKCSCSVVHSLLSLE